MGTQYFGASVSRVEDARLLRGAGRYVDDITFPGMLHAKYLRSPYGRVKIKSMDVSKAKALEGVVDIVTWDDPEVLAIKGARETLIPNDAETENQEIGAVVVAETPEICDEAFQQCFHAVPRHGTLRKISP